MTNQPEWQLVYSTDTEALYIDSTGEYDPKLMLLEEYETARGSTRFLVHRFGLEPYKIVRVTEDDTTTRYLVPVNYETSWPHAASQYVPWFYKHLESIASSGGTTKIALIKALCSDEPHERAQAYRDIAGCQGADNFDSEPLDLTESAVQNWPDLDGRAQITISTNDDDDGFVTLYCDDAEAAHDAQSVLGTHWEFCDGQAYASASDTPDLEELLEAEGYEVDSSQWSAPDDEDLAYWHAKYERANGATPERLRGILGWATVESVLSTRRVQDALHAARIAAHDEVAYAAACYDAGWILDAEEWITAHGG